MTTDAAFWDKTAESYAASPIKNMQAYEQTMERTRAYLSKEDQVLEVGCGTGSTALLLASEVAQVTATDISPNMLAIGRRRAKDQGVSNVRFVEAGLPGAALEGAPYDAILAFNMLHLVHDLPAVLATLRDALEPGGVLVSKTVCLAQQTRLWAIPLWLLRLVGKAPYVHLMTFDALERAVTEAGFEIVETGVYPAPFSRFVVARRV